MIGRPSSTIPRRYARALNSFLLNGHEAALLEAYEIGREALAEGFGLLDITMLHHEALAALPHENEPNGLFESMEQAAVFLAECLSPFEMSLTGYRESNERLAGANTELARAKAEIEAAHRRLLAETAERERAEEALRQAQRLQAVGQLAGGIAHHFNNLLTVVMGNLHMARRRASEDPKLERLLAQATAGAERGAAVTKQLLAFSRRQMLKPELLETSPRLGESMALLSGALGGAIAIESDIPADLPPIEIDPTELDLALLNLALNARDAMSGAGTLRVSAAARPVQNERLGLNGDYLVIEVADTGIGIAPEHVARVFDPFFTTKGAGGTGLGLSQVHGFAAQSGGAAEIESEPGVGTRVRLYLPHKPMPAQAAAPIFGVEETDSEEVKGTVLVVDDDVSVASLAAELLEDGGFRVRLAYRARVALDLLRTDFSVDLLFSDIVMPDGMDGIALAQEVRKLRPALPILLTTGYSEALSDGRAQASGLEVLPKPYKASELLHGIAALMERR
jgi:signal transduction histidine kinase/CheY-like chemotaxis protein